MQALNTLISIPALKATAFATVSLFWTHHVCLRLQAKARGRVGARAPEDEMLSKRPQNFVGTESGAKNKDAVANFERLNSIVKNNLENIPIGLIVAWTSLLTAYSPRAQIVLVSVFAVSRIAFAVAYAKGLQPHRSLVYMLGFGSVLGLMANGLYGAFQL
eukprot:c6640_g1_i1.p1 GENE.c6640_g1_i1~~c6640_g1_i1.p1  ORF type:complete len:177 (+),score=45.99 c6640_g1_i1:53-532(+)